MASATSRLCVKNLPKHVNDEHLRDFFSKVKGVVTDAKVMRTANGRSRCFGFVGFDSVETASTAQAHFHKTFFGTHKIDVEFAQRKGDEGLKRPWSKYSSGSSRHKESDAATKDRPEARQNGTTKPAKSETVRSTVNETAEYRDFLETSRSKGHAWETGAEKINMQQQQPVSSDSDDSDDDDAFELEDENVGKTINGDTDPDEWDETLQDDGNGQFLRDNVKKEGAVPETAGKYATHDHVSHL
jgi:multiple RNA-binding domain-containing protein 1